MKTPQQWIETIKHAEGEQVMPVPVDEEDIGAIQTDAFWSGVRAALNHAIKKGVLYRDECSEAHHNISMEDSYDHATVEP